MTAPSRSLATVSLLLAASLPGAGVHAAPIRTESPGTGAVGRFSLVERLTADDEEGGGERLRDAVSWTAIRYAPTARWLLGVRVPEILSRRVAVRDLGRASRTGLGDLWLTAKLRFFRQVGRWWDQQAALDVAAKLPTGESRAPTDPRWPLQDRRDAQLGTGSTDGAATLSYQRGHGRFVQAADLGIRKNGRGSDAYTAGDELRADLDLEYILLPRHYEVPGHELFTLIEMAGVHKEADRHLGSALPPTRRTELLVAPGLEYVATERAALSVSWQLPVARRIPPGGRRTRSNLLLELRYAF
jgi:hypothetical protein